MIPNPHAVALIAHRKLKAQMRLEYPPEQFVAIKWGRVIADDVSMDGLEEKLAKQDLRWDQVIVEQAGYDREIVDEYPGMIMMEAIYGHWNECVTPPETPT